MGRALKFFVLGLLFIAAGIGLLSYSFYAGLVVMAIGVSILGWYQGEFLRQIILWSQRKGAGNQAKAPPPESSSQLTSAEKPYVIGNPTIGFLNLAGNDGDRLAQHDRGQLSSVFAATSNIESNKVPRCNVLFLYCALAPSGKISAQAYSLRDIIQAAGAHIAVVASDIPHGVVTSSEFAQFLQSKNDWPANIVITLNRNGDAFSRFFKNLFSQMHHGTTMPHAWVKLAPQGPASNADQPGTVVLLEAGHIAFAMS